MKKSNEYSDQQRWILDNQVLNYFITFYIDFNWLPIAFTQPPLQPSIPRFFAAFHERRSFEQVVGDIVINFNVRDEHRINAVVIGAANLTKKSSLFYFRLITIIKYRSSIGNAVLKFDFGARSPQRQPRSFEHRHAFRLHIEAVPAVGDEYLYAMISVYSQKNIELHWREMGLWG